MPSQAIAVEGDVRNKAKTVQQMVGELDEKKVRLLVAPSLPSSCALIPLVAGHARRRLAGARD